MKMAKNFKELRAGMSAEAKAASAVEHRHLVEEIKLHPLRQARELTQTKIAGELHTGRSDTRESSPCAGDLRVVRKAKQS
jgi:hypothetical protein